MTNNILEKRLQEFAEDWSSVDLPTQKHVVDLFAIRYLEHFAKKEDHNKWIQYYESCKEVLK